MLFIKTVLNSTKKDALINVENIMIVKPNHDNDAHSDIHLKDGSIAVVLSPFGFLASIISNHD